MKFSIGDKVLLTRTGEEGVVTACISAEIFEVEAGGVTFPVHADDMDHPYLKWFTEKKKKKAAPLPEQLPVEKEKFPAARLAKGIYLSLLPVYRLEEMEDVVELLRIFLVNELPFALRYRYDVRITGKSLFTHEGTLAPFSHIYLHNIPYPLMNDQPRFHWSVADGAAEAGGIIRIRPARLFAQITELQQKNEPMFSYLLAETLIPAAPETPAVSSPPSMQAPPAPRRSRTSALPTSVLQDQPRHEIDLHIEQLIPHTRGLSNAEILRIQLMHFQHYLRLAIAHRLDRIIVIHGLGRGVLRDAVHEVLRETPEVARFTNEWMGKYGFGATEVYLSF